MRIIMGDLLTGRRILDVPFMAASWSVEINGPGTVTATVDLRDPAVAALGMWNASMPGKTFLAAASGDLIFEAGPIWSRAYNRDSGQLTLTAKGLWSYFDHRTVLPFIGDQPVVDATTGESAAYANTALTGMHLGTIGKRLVQQSMTWPGGNLPIDFEPDKSGDNERNYLGAELPVIGQMLDNLTGVENGPDIEFRPRFSADKLGVRWLYRSGDPRLGSQTVHLIDASVAASPVESLTDSESADMMGSLGWCSGGRSADVALIERHLDTRLLDAGFPLLERLDTSRSSVTQVATLKAYAAELARNGDRPMSSWTATVRMGGEGEPRLGELWNGDTADFKIRRDLFMPDGNYRRRIMSMSGKAGSNFVTLGIGATYG